MTNERALDDLAEQLAKMVDDGKKDTPEYFQLLDEWQDLARQVVEENILGIRDNGYED